MSELGDPDTRLRISVALPARDEQKLVGGCVAALAAQREIGPGELEVLLVLDACRDATRQRASAAARDHPALALHLLQGPGAGAGAARRVGMEAACRRLLAVGRAHGLVASTDADSTTDPGWARAQLDAAERGARAIGGRVELSEADRVDLGPGIVGRRERQARERHGRLLAADLPPGSTVEHWQFSGASMAVTAETYRAVGGLAPRRALEDEAFERSLLSHGVPIQRSLAVRVTTSGRLDGRAERGLARDLAEAARAERRR